MKWQDEFKLYENMWETNNVKQDPVQQILDQTPDIEFDYAGFKRERSEDHFDPNSLYGHYTKDWTDSYGSFTYKVDAITVFEDMRDEMIPSYLDKVEQSDLTAECKKVYDAWYNATEETEAETGEAFELFVAKNLETLAKVFEEYLLEKYAEDAEDWAEKNLEPIDFSDWF